MSFLTSTLTYSFGLFRALTQKKIINFIKLQFSYLLSKIGVQFLTQNSPFFISVEPANYCNLHCPECPVGNKTNNSPAHLLFDFTRYEKLIDELSPTLLHIIFYFQGEPLINKQLPKMIDYAHKARIFTSTSSNAQFLTKDLAKELVLSGLDKLIVSVDGSTQETYEAYRIGGKLEKALDGIKHIISWKNEFRSPTPLVEIQFLVLKTNEHQIADMKLLKKKLGADRLTFKTAQLYNYEHGHPLMTTIKKYSRYKQKQNGDYELKANQPNRCWRLWNGAVINSSAEVVPCCYDKLSAHSFGNINSDSFNNIWHNAKASDFRGKILQNRKQFEMCRNCTSK